MSNRPRLLRLAILAALPAVAFAQERQSRSRIDVEHYQIDAEINPRTQTLAATVEVRFTPLDNATSLSFELNNALSLAKVVDGSGRQIPASRIQQDGAIRLSFPEPLTKGQKSTLVFTYDGRLTGTEESPVFGIRFASIQNDFAYLLYPARWFPVNDYTSDRFSSDMRVVVPAGYKVLSSGVDGSDTAPEEKVAFKFRYTQASFPGSLAVVKGEGKSVSSGGVNTTFYLRTTPDAAAAHADEISRIMTYFTSVFGLPPKAALTVIETENGAPNGFAAPGLLFVNTKSIAKQPNTRMLANQIARQWWGTLVSAVTRNHMWIENGVARYAELLYLEHAHGASALEAEIKDTYVEALTVDQPPLIQAARFEDYSPEYWAATAAKGAAVLHMLRGIIGDEAFNKLLKAIPERHSWKSVSTAEFQKTAEEVSGKGLQYFFVEWIESSGAPQFTLEYVVMRTGKGFRVDGKISQDLDTFRMPVELQIETEGNPESKTVEVVGTSSTFSVETFGRPKHVIVDPKGRVLRFSDQMRVAVAIRRGEMFMELGEYAEALKEYQKALEVNRASSLAHYRVAEVFFLQGNNQSAANEFREALNGDLEPKWTEVWAHINLGKVFDISDQRQRAVNEYKLALRTKDNTQGALEEAAKYIETPYQKAATSN